MSSQIQRSAARPALALPAAACLAAWPRPWAGQRVLRRALAAPLGAHMPEAPSYPSAHDVLLCLQHDLHV
jgi:hypothetical protein